MLIKKTMHSVLYYYSDNLANQQSVTNCLIQVAQLCTGKNACLPKWLVFLDDVLKSELTASIGCLFKQVSESTGCNCLYFLLHSCAPKRMRVYQSGAPFSMMSQVKVSSEQLLFESVEINQIKDIVFSRKVVSQKRSFDLGESHP